jgi:hypothetical protein
MCADRKTQLILASAVTATFAGLSLTFMFQVIDYAVFQQVTVVAGAILGSVAILALGDKNDETTK